MVTYLQVIYKASQHQKSMQIPFLQTIKASLLRRTILKETHHPQSMISLQCKAVMYKEVSFLQAISYKPTFIKALLAKAYLQKIRIIQIWLMDYKNKKIIQVSIQLLMVKYSNNSSIIKKIKIYLSLS